MSTPGGDNAGQIIAGSVIAAVVYLGALTGVQMVTGWPQWIVVGAGLVIGAAIAAVATVTYPLWGLTPAQRKLRDTKDLGDVMGAGAAKKGAELRGLDDHDGQDMAQLAVVIGKVAGRKKLLYKTLEDFCLVIMGPRSNKTSSQAVPRILAAPGAVVATSNKPDLWILTAAMRKVHGPIYAYDPGQIAFATQMWWWNILRDITSFNSAKRIATHFMAGVGSNNSESGNSGFFDSGAKFMLARNLLAAALSGHTMRDVVTWIDTYSRKPVELLREHGQRRAADALEGQLDLPHETLGGIQGGAAAALACIQDESALTWITPPDTWIDQPDHEVPELDLWTLFTATTDDAPTLYLMTQEGAESSGPVVAAMVDHIFKLGDLAASAQGGRVDPPVTMVLDEAANICRIKELPDKASHLGSKGILVDVILQSYQQGMGVWGREQMGALWGASTCRIIGAGLQNIEDARMISDLVGTHKIWQTNSNGPQGKSRSLVDEPIMRPEEVAAMSRAHALLIRQGSRPVLMDLLPWYTEDDSREIKDIARRATSEIRDSAMTALGTTNSLGRHLHQIAGTENTTKAQSA
ncbi:type IV secretory system conjugative DNA transfer family protein [Williamsia sp. 1135]|uniref:type IV secretory system conjugative DNA transfer family protein n=1 Tax=Williamsia sp. 1135 TaxID=1889262 RepID=UPI000A0FDFF8|nr:type IV secretory system conjugative DNA transfer family protein [Williamsia sp. 1135]ORM35506.1 hypothetical protein BFL43_09300 [Williamsia sp. 1135]